MTCLALAFAYAGFVSLRLGQRRYTPGGSGRAAVFRIAGSALLAASCIASIARWGWTFGPVAWPLVLTLAAIAVIFLPAYAPRTAMALAFALPVVAVLPALAGIG
jgi:hypothetical protein